MLRGAILILMLIAESSQSQTVETARYNAVLEVVDEVALCVTLLTLVGSASETDVGMELQLQVDADFYSYDNRAVRMMEILGRENSRLFEVGYGELNEDEQNSIMMKIFVAGSRNGEELLTKASEFGLSTLDDTYRDCVRVYNLDN